ncbi:Hypothetical predicted protein [Paramuricea clavata]|uniref:Uncharacterized protein n=1 Tax=Paramuricea clavata TaxID=317549 RepID=A0A6S7FKR2_PARCT|nr:Hypothetical predicted protein [Paramuricea clavata]
MKSETEYKRARVSSVRHLALQLQERNSLKTRTMKTFALLCFLLLASACVFVARAEEETAVEEPKTEDQPEVAADEEQPEEEATESDEEEKEADEESEDEENDEENTDVAEDEEKESDSYYPVHKCSIHLKCRPVCRKKVCSRRRCKRVKCGSRKICRKIIKIRVVKVQYKIDSYDGYGYGPKYGYKIKKIPHKVIICHRIPKYCTRCHTIRYVCGKICHKVCHKVKKCYKSYY